MDGERPIEWFEDVKEFHAHSGKKKGVLIMSNFRLIFMSTLAGYSNTYAVDYSVDLANIISASPEKDKGDWRFKTGGFNQTLVVLVRNREHFEFGKEGIHNVIPELEQLISMRKAAVKAIQAEEQAKPAQDERPAVVRPEKQAPSQTVLKEKEIHVIVKVPCRYCGVLNDQFAAKCESCGAPTR
jgi:hypothetical protein